MSVPLNDKGDEVPSWESRPKVVEYIKTELDEILAARVWSDIEMVGYPETVEVVNPGLYVVGTSIEDVGLNILVGRVVCKTC